MPIAVTHALSLEEAHIAFPGLAALMSWSQENLPPTSSVASVFPQSHWPTALGVDAELLVLILPEDHDALEIAASPLDVLNVDSDDLLSRRTFMTLSSHQSRVEIDARQCDFHPAVEAGKFFIAVATPRAFALACHDLGQEAVDGLMGCLQASCGSSGVNYRPYRIWSKEQLEAAAKGEAIPELDPVVGHVPERIDCTVVTWTDSEN